MLHERYESMKCFLNFKNFGNDSLLQFLDYKALNE